MSSRSFDEYVAMFDLDEAAWTQRRVLDCSAGASSFLLHVRDAAARAVAADPVYAMSRDALAQTVAESNRTGASIAVDNADRFTWKWYGDQPTRERMRARALAEFVLDIASRHDGYVAGALPRLPFRDDAFDLALCSHLLFTWADELGLDWHLAALRELSRVAPEVRVFPTVLQRRGEPVPFWDELLELLRADGLRPERRVVPYEFQIGGNTMLVVSRSRSR